MTNTRKKLANAGTAETGLNAQASAMVYIIVLSVLPDSPGTKAGIRSGDIFRIHQRIYDTRNMSVGQAINLLNGQAGTGIKVRSDPPRQGYAGGSRSRSGEVVRAEDCDAEGGP